MNPNGFVFAVSTTSQMSIPMGSVNKLHLVDQGDVHAANIHFVPECFFKIVVNALIVFGSRGTADRSAS